MKRPEPDLPRLPYTYVPGGPWPHPVSHPGGHSYRVGRSRPVPLSEPEGASAFRHAIALYHAGYYWEAHEVWEGLWIAEGRTGPVAEALRGLIALAAAGVKVRQGQPRGVASHARRAARRLAAAQVRLGPSWLGLGLERIETGALALAIDPPHCPDPPGDPARDVLGLRLDDRATGED